MIRKIMHCPQAVLGLAMMLLVFLVMLLAPVFAPNNPMQLNVAHSFAPAGCTVSPRNGRAWALRPLPLNLRGKGFSEYCTAHYLLLLAVISTVVATLCAYIGGHWTAYLKWSPIFLWPFPVPRCNHSGGAL